MQVSFQQPDETKQSTLKMSQEMVRYFFLHDKCECMVSSKVLPTILMNLLLSCLLTLSIIFWRKPDRQSIPKLLIWKHYLIVKWVYEWNMLTSGFLPALFCTYVVMCWCLHVYLWCTFTVLGMLSSSHQCTLSFTALLYSWIWQSLYRKSWEIRCWSHNLAVRWICGTYTSLSFSCFIFSSIIMPSCLLCSPSSEDCSTTWGFGYNDQQRCWILCIDPCAKLCFQEGIQVYRAGL